MVRDKEKQNTQMGGKWIFLNTIRLPSESKKNSFGQEHKKKNAVIY